MTARICRSPSLLGAGHDRNERRTWMVVALTTIMMVGEIAGGIIFGSIALVADGWHMSSHAAALTVAALAYRFARLHAHDARFAFGTGKVGELAGFASAVALGIVAILIGWEALLRFFNPQEIHFKQAIAVATLGLVVNLVSARLLHQSESDSNHGHDHHHHHHHHYDNNLRAAYIHVLADALTSILAILALLAGWLLGWMWMDPAIGIVGAIVIAHWSWGLMKAASASLLDISDDEALLQRIRAGLESNGDRIDDLHVWRLAPGHRALSVSIVSAAPASPAIYKKRLSEIEAFSHMTVEVNPAFDMR